MKRIEHNGRIKVGDFKPGTILWAKWLVRDLPNKPLRHVEELLIGETHLRHWERLGSLNASEPVRDITLEEVYEISRSDLPLFMHFDNLSPDFEKLLKGESTSVQ